MVKLFKFFVILIFISTPFIGLSQSGVLLKNIPKEEIKTSVNTNLLMVGESLYFKTYSFLQKSQEISAISKIAYIQLIADNKTIVSQLKIKLEDGMGHGDFFIPTSLETGVYKLISYSNWSLNNGKNPYSETDIFIINPYFKSENNLKLPKIELSLDSLFVSNPTNKLKSYPTRSKVQLNIADLLPVNFKGNYMISVRKQEPVLFPSGASKEFSTNKQFNDQPFYIPEIRGEVIQGKVINTKTKEPASNIIVALSISGNTSLYKNVLTNEQGAYFFVLDAPYKSGFLVTQIINENRSEYSLIEDKKEFPFLNNLSFKRIVLNSNLENYLIEKSIDTQIDNAFYKLKEDKFIAENQSKIFFHTAKKKYILDDYNRFPTLRETFIEIIKNASIKRKNGHYYFDINNVQNHLLSKLPELEPLVLIDGFPIQNHETIINMSSFDIKSIELIDEVYFYGPKIYKGILSFITKKENFAPAGSKDYVLKRIIHAPQKEKQVYSIDYSIPGKLKRIPDFRSQLYWKSDIEIESSSKTIEFYTSDLKGLFKVVLEAHNASGDFIRKEQHFLVE